MALFLFALFRAGFELLSWRGDHGLPLELKAVRFSSAVITTHATAQNRRGWPWDGNRILGAPSFSPCRSAATFRAVFSAANPGLKPWAMILSHFAASPKNPQGFNPGFRCGSQFQSQPIVGQGARFRERFTGLSVTNIVAKMGEESAFRLQQ